MVEIAHSIQEIYKIKFTQNWSPFWPYDVILTHKIALFEHFEQIFPDFRLFDHSNIEFNLEKHGWDCSQYQGDHFKIKIFRDFPPFWHYDVILAHKNALF